MSKEQFDEEKLWRCPLLGGGVPFRHCRKTNDSLPCPRIVDCWHGRMDLPAFLLENYSEDELKRALQPSQGRLDTILKSVQKFSD